MYDCWFSLFIRSSVDWTLLRFFFQLKSFFFSVDLKGVCWQIKSVQILTRCWIPVFMCCFFHILWINRAKKTPSSWCFFLWFTVQKFGSKSWTDSRASVQLGLLSRAVLGILKHWFYSHRSGERRRIWEHSGSSDFHWPLTFVERKPSPGSVNHAFFCVGFWKQRYEIHLNFNPEMETTCVLQKERTC